MPETTEDLVSVWQGEFPLWGVILRCHVLSDGTRIIEADSLAALMQAWADCAPVDEAEAAAFARWQRGDTRDGLETIIPAVNPVKPRDRFVIQNRHDPATCRNGDHYGQCSGVTALGGDNDG